jgi:antitoxin component YwqK of YwqJK toxin-antitoxin module
MRFPVIILLLTVIPLNAQKPTCRCDELTTERPQGGVFYYSKGGQEFNGYCYRMYGASPKDTFNIEGYKNGRPNYVRQYYPNGKLQRILRTYDKAVRDSILADDVSFTQAGDTLSWAIDYLKNQKREKWNVTIYYYERSPGGKLVPRQITYQRYFSREEGKQLNENLFLDERIYDAYGFSHISAREGIEIKYHHNGRIESTGYYGEYRLAIRRNDLYTAGECKTGTWTTYDVDGNIRSVTIYDEDGNCLNEKTWYKGWLTSERIYRKKGSLIILPPHDGVKFDSAHSCFVQHTIYWPNGKIFEETFSDTLGTNFTYGYFENGRARTLKSYVNSRPAGIHREWDSLGNVTRFVNYSVDTNDTLAYKAFGGTIRVLDLKHPDTLIGWGQMQRPHYTQDAETWLIGKANIYKTFYADGKPREEIHLVHGIREGNSVGYYPDGKMWIRAVYHNDSLAGDFTEWYENGQIKTQAVYDRGMRSGKYMEYYADGNVKWSNIYPAGSPLKAMAFTSSGAKIKTGNYVQAFFPDSLRKRLELMYGERALAFFYADSSVRKFWSSLILPAEIFQPYLDIAVFTAVKMDTTGMVTRYEMESHASHYNTFDSRHSAFMIDARVYSDSSEKKIVLYLFQHGIKVDSVVKKDGYLPGYNFYISSKDFLNKPAILGGIMTTLGGWGVFPVDASYGEIYEIGDSGLYYEVKNFAGVKRVMYGFGYGDCPSGCITRVYYYFYVYPDMSCDFSGMSSNYRIRYWIETSEY